MDDETRLEAEDLFMLKLIEQEIENGTVKLTDIINLIGFDWIRFRFYNAIYFRRFQSHFACYSWASAQAFT
jgi:hypothetical protein